MPNARKTSFGLILLLGFVGFVTMPTPTIAQTKTTCSSCKGSGYGNLKCNGPCGGTGKTKNGFKCSWCNGTGWKTCANCKGSGRTTVMSRRGIVPSQTICTSCRGSGYGSLKCNGPCGGTGKTKNGFKCTWCNGTGWKHCANCKGNGKR